MTNSLQGRRLVALGALLAPASQWLVFWGLSRRDPEVAGQFATVLSVATPVFVTSAWGLRNLQVTLRVEYELLAYLRLRSGLTLIGGLFLAMFGRILAIPAVIVLVILVMKVADAASDQLYGYLQRNSKLFAFGVLMILNGVLTATMVGACVVVGLSVWAVMSSTAIASVASAATGYIWLCHGQRDELRPKEPVKTLDGTRELLSYGASIVGAQLLSSVIINAPTWAVAASGSSADVGVFAGVGYLLTLGSVVGSTLNSVLLSEFREVFKTSGSRGLRRSVARIERRILAIGALLNVCMFFCGGTFFSLIYGADYFYSRWDLLGLTVASVLAPCSFALNAVLLVLNCYRDQLVIQCVIGVAVFLAWVLVVRGAPSAMSSGVVVALASSVCSLLGSAVMVSWRVRRA